MSEPSALKLDVQANRAALLITVQCAEDFNMQRSDKCLIGCSQRMGIRGETNFANWLGLNNPNDLVMPIGYNIAHPEDQRIAINYLRELSEIPGAVSVDRMWLANGRAGMNV